LIWLNYQIWHYISTPTTEVISRNRAAESLRLVLALCSTQHTGEIRLLNSKWQREDGNSLIMKRNYGINCVDEEN